MTLDAGGGLHAGIRTETQRRLMFEALRETTARVELLLDSVDAALGGRECGDPEPEHCRNLARAFTTHFRMREVFGPASHPLSDELFQALRNTTRMMGLLAGLFEAIRQVEKSERPLPRAKVAFLEAHVVLWRHQLRALRIRMREAIGDPSWNSQEGSTSD